MKNFEKIKNMNIDEFANYIRCECLSSNFNGVVKSVDEIKRWLESATESKNNKKATFDTYEDCYQISENDYDVYI